VEISFSTKTRLVGHEDFFHAYVEEGCSFYLPIARQKNLEVHAFINLFKAVLSRTDQFLWPPSLLKRSIDTFEFAVLPK
jgi:hypothetical protein